MENSCCLAFVRAGRVFVLCLQCVMSNNMEVSAATTLSDERLMASEADPLSQNRGPFLSGVQGSTLEPQGCYKRGFFRPTTLTKPTEPASPTMTTLPSKQTTPTKPASPAKTTSPTRSTNTALAPSQPQIGSKPDNCTIIADFDGTEDIEEDDTLIIGNKTLVLNSVLAFVHNILGPINSKLVTNQLSEFYSRKKLLGAYKLGASLLPQQRILRQSPDPCTWKTLLICHHIISTVQLLRQENIWFASLNLDVPLVPLYDIPKTSDTASSNPFWKFLTNRKSKPYLDKFTQCDLNSDKVHTNYIEQNISATESANKFDNAESDNNRDSAKKKIDNNNSSNHMEKVNNIIDSSPDNTNNTFSESENKFDKPVSDKNRDSEKKKIDSINISNQMEKVNNISVSSGNATNNTFKRASNIPEKNGKSIVKQLQREVISKNSQKEPPNKLPESVKDKFSGSIVNNRIDDTIGSTLNDIVESAIHSHNIDIPDIPELSQINTTDNIADFNPSTIRKDVGTQFTDNKHSYIMTPKTSTPLHPQEVENPIKNPQLINELINSNQDILEAILSIHKTVLRRLPKSKNKNMITRKKNY